MTEVSNTHPKAVQRNADKPYSSANDKRIISSLVTSVEAGQPIPGLIVEAVETAGKPPWE